MNPRGSGCPAIYMPLSARDPNYPLPLAHYENLFPDRPTPQKKGTRQEKRGILRRLRTRRLEELRKIVPGEKGSHMG